MKLTLPYLNKVMITGRLVRNPELRVTNTGVPVSNFKIACNKEYLDHQGETKEEVCYIGIAAWNNLARNCNGRLLKGTEVHIEGELKSRLRRNENGVKRSFVEIRAGNVKFINSNGILEDLGEENSPLTFQATDEQSVSPILYDNVDAESEEIFNDPASDKVSHFNLVSDEHEEL